MILCWKMPQRHKPLCTYSKKRNLTLSQIETVAHAIQSVYTEFGAVRLFDGVGDAVHRVLFGAT